MSLIISRQQQIHLMTGRVFSFPLPDANFLSLLSNDEVNAVVLSREFAVEMEKVFAVDLANSRQIQRDEWEKRPCLPRVQEWFINLFVRWL